MDKFGIMMNASMKTSVHVTVRQLELGNVELGEILTTPLSMEVSITSKDNANTLSLSRTEMMNSEICQRLKSMSIRNSVALFLAQSLALMVGLSNSQDEIKVPMKLLGT